MSSKARRTSKNGEIPVAPLRRHIQRWIDSQGYVSTIEARFGSTDGQFAPNRKFIETIWPSDDYNRSYRSFWRIMHETECISFDLADRIICDVLCEPDLWIADEELAEAYANVDLRTLDATKPTCEAVAEKIGENIVQAYRELGSINAVVRQQGIAHGRIKAILKARGEYACA